MKIEELIDRGDETGQRIRETLNVLLESPYFYRRFSNASPPSGTTRPPSSTSRSNRTAR